MRDQPSLLKLGKLRANYQASLEGRLIVSCMFLQHAN